MTRSSLSSISRVVLTAILVSLFGFSTGCIVRPGYGHYGHHHHHRRW